jgi:carbamoyl-phosphate synthase large subunit
MECFREALFDNGLTGQVFVVDNSIDAPTVHLADKAWQVPRCTDPRYTDAILGIAVREHVSVIIPTIDGELLPFAKSRNTFLSNGIFVAVSDPPAVQICRDKVLTHSWLVENDFPTIHQSTPAHVLAQYGDWALPLIVKPRDGSASKGVRLIRSFDELRAVAALGPDLIVQEMARGIEHTINVFVDENGRCVCAIPHQRLEVRSGEVSKAVTFKNRPMMELATKIAERLPGARGMLNIQLFRSSDDVLKVIEINARVGGGYPVAHRAGGRFTHWLIEELIEAPSTAAFDQWEDDLAMLRYDSAIFLPGAAIRRSSGLGLAGATSATGSNGEPRLAVEPAKPAAISDL